MCCIGVFMVSFDLHIGDNIEFLINQPENSIDGCITDPPYGMNMKDWDKDVPTKELWQGVYRVLKPGAFCLSFCSPELYHRMATKVEEGGFIIKDQVIWMITTKMAKANRLKPAHEPIVVAQKPISEKSIKANQNKWGTGIINIEDSRIPWDKEPPTGWVKNGHKRRTFAQGGNTKGNREDEGTTDANPNGRYPSNIVGLFDNPEHQKYFYAPRVSAKERAGNPHPTPKPIDLMSWLIKVYTPPKGIVLDPFMGSGSTGVAALLTDRRFLGIDKEETYVKFAEERLNNYNLFIF